MERSLSIFSDKGIWTNAQKENGRDNFKLKTGIDHWHFSCCFCCVDFHILFTWTFYHSVSSCLHRKYLKSFHFVGGSFLAVDWEWLLTYSTAMKSSSALSQCTKLPSSFPLIKYGLEADIDNLAGVSFFILPLFICLLNSAEFVSKCLL